MDEGNTTTPAPAPAPETPETKAKPKANRGGRPKIRGSRLEKLQARAVKAYVECGTISGAARLVGVTRGTMRKWAHDPVFAEEVEDEKRSRLNRGDKVTYEFLMDTIENDDEEMQSRLMAVKLYNEYRRDRLAPAGNDKGYGKPTEPCRTLQEMVQQIHLFIPTTDSKRPKVERPEPMKVEAEIVGPIPVPHALSWKSIDEGETAGTNA